MTSAHSSHPPLLPADQQCERCARCLSVCPSYAGFLQETMSPRGRWELVRAIQAGELEPGPRAAQAFSRCLQCMACVEACPRSVDVPAAVLAARRALARNKAPAKRLERRLMAWSLKHRKGVAEAGRLLSPLRRLFPKRPSGGRHLPLLLPHVLAGRRLPRIANKSIFTVQPKAYAAAASPFRGEVLLFTGCFFGLIDPAPAQAAIKVLTANGFAVRLPHDQACCGGPAWYAGHPDLALESLEQNLAALLQGPRSAPLPILTLCATCGNMLRNHTALVAGQKDDPKLQEKAAALAARTRDCCDFLAGLPNLKQGNKRPTRITFHDPCHLLRGMHVRDAVRTLLRAVPGLDMVEASTRTTCCGGGGLGSIKHPGQADRIGQERIKDLLATRAQVVASACPGCLLQLRDQFSRHGGRMRAVHPLEILAASYS